MTISVGNNIPEATLKILEENNVKNIDILEYLKNKKVVLFSVPGAFTTTCSAKHLPGFIECHKDISDLGIDEIICIAVNDAFVMKAWEKDQNAKGKVTLLADGNGDFTKGLGLLFDGSKFGLGTRGKRFAMVIDNCKVTHLAVEEAGAFEVSNAESIIQLIKENS